MVAFATEQQKVPQVEKLPRGTLHKKDSNLPIALRDWSIAKTTLRKYGVSQDDVADYIDTPKSTINRCLDFRRFYRAEHINLMRVRSAVELLLDEAGWPQADDVAQGVNDLWQDYESELCEMM